MNGHGVDLAKERLRRSDTLVDYAHPSLSIKRPSRIADAGRSDAGRRVFARGAAGSRRGNPRDGNRRDEEQPNGGKGDKCDRGQSQGDGERCSAPRQEKRQDREQRRNRQDGKHAATLAGHERLATR